MTLLLVLSITGDQRGIQRPNAGLSGRNRQVAGVVAVCPPLRLQVFPSRFAPSLEIWNRLMSAVHYHKGKREFLEMSLEHPDINYQ